MPYVDRDESGRVIGAYAAAQPGQAEEWVEDGDPDLAPPSVVPDQPTLADWRVGLLLWQRLDDVTSRVAGLMASTKPAEAILGRIAQQQLEYSNNVTRARLVQIREAFGFSAAEVDESLWRADRVAQGDLSGVWPLPAA